MATQPVVNYVAAPQANIYFGGILIDECYDIQYTYREAKEPIYGYLSKHFDAIVPGTVIITGALTINYKHDQYLSKVLEKASNPVRGIKNKNSRPITLRKYQEEYKNLLGKYADAIKKQAELKKELAWAITERDTVVGYYNDYRSDYEIKIDKLKSEANAIREEQSLSEKGVSSDDATRLTIVEGEMAKLEKQKDDYLNDPNSTSGIDDWTTEIGYIEQQLKDLDVNGLRNQINDMKNKVNSLMVTSNDLPLLTGDETSESLGSVRAEEFRNGFTVEFNYNGSPHKRILGCELIGHGHVITQSGMPVKEQYTFIGKRME